MPGEVAVILIAITPIQKMREDREKLVRFYYSEERSAG